MNKRVLIAKDSFIAYIGLQSIIKNLYPEINIDYASDQKKLQTALQNIVYDIVFLDFGIQSLQVGKLISQWKVLNPFVKIVIFYHSDEIFLRFRNAGVNGFISNKGDVSEIKKAINTVFEKGCYYPKEQVQIVANAIKRKTLIATLSKREYQIFELLRNGESNKHIMLKLGIRPSTVSTFKKSIFNKLEVKTILELAKIYR